MKVFRITKARHTRRAFSGEGARLAGGRWTYPGEAAVYCSSTLALAALETFVHIGEEGRTLAFASFEVNIPASVRVHRVVATTLMRARPQTVPAFPVGSPSPLLAMLALAGLGTLIQLWMMRRRPIPARASAPASKLPSAPQPTTATRASNNRC